MTHTETMKDMISVLIPAYNSEKFISDAIESAIAQDIEAETEIIVVDDGSKDATKEICLKFPEVQYYYQENHGPGSARNSLIRKMNGNFVAFLDADDIWTPDKLKIQYEYLRQHPKVPFVGCYVHVFSSDFPNEPYTEDGNSQHHLIPCLIRKNVIDRCGCFNENLRIGEDTEYRFRMRSIGITGETIIPKVLLLKRKHNGNISMGNRNKECDLASVLRESVRSRK